MYKILFLSIFFITRSIPYGVLIFASTSIDETSYIFLENSIALSTLVALIIGFGIPSVINVVKDNFDNNLIIFLHVLITSILLIAVGVIFFFNENTLFNIILFLSVYFLINTTLISNLKIRNKRILPLILDGIIYVVIFLVIMQHYFFETEFLNILKISYLLLVIIYLFFFIFFRKNYFYLNFARNKLKNFKFIYTKGTNILFCSFILLSFSLYPRIFVVYFDDVERFQYLINFRIAFIGMLFHQLMANYYYTNFFKKNLAHVIKLSLFSAILTFFFSIITVTIYILLEKNFNYPIAKIKFDIAICIQIFLISTVGFTNLILIRLKFNLKKIFFTSAIIISIYLYTYISSRIFLDDINIMIFYHLFFGIFLIYVIMTDPKIKKLKFYK